MRLRLWWMSCWNPNIMENDGRGIGSMWRDIVMGWADLAISAGGSTCWELAFMGVPTLAIILADNQQAIAQGLEEEGVAVNLGGYGHLSREIIARKFIEIANAASTRAQMSQRGRKLIDGKGTQRVLKDLLLQ